MAAVPPEAWQLVPEARRLSKQGLASKRAHHSGVEYRHPGCCGKAEILARRRLYAILIDGLIDGVAVKIRAQESYMLIGFSVFGADSSRGADELDSMDAELVQG